MPVMSVMPFWHTDFLFSPLDKFQEKKNTSWLCIKACRPKMPWVTVLIATISCLLMRHGYCQSNSSENFLFSSDPVPPSSHSSSSAFDSRNGSGHIRSNPPACLRRTSMNGVFKNLNTVLFCVIYVVGIVGNATLLRIICFHKNMRNGPNALIASLALGDFIYIAIDNPIQIYKVV